MTARRVRIIGNPLAFPCGPARTPLDTEKPEELKWGRGIAERVIRRLAEMTDRELGSAIYWHMAMEMRDIAETHWLCERKAAAGAHRKANMNTAIRRMMVSEVERRKTGRGDETVKAIAGYLGKAKPKHMPPPEIPAEGE